MFTVSTECRINWTIWRPYARRDLQGRDDNYTIQYWGRRLSHESDSLNLAVFMKVNFKGDFPIKLWGRRLSHETRSFREIMW